MPGMSGSVRIIPSDQGGDLKGRDDGNRGVGGDPVECRNEATDVRDGPVDADRGENGGEMVLPSSCRIDAGKFGQDSGHAQVDGGR